jgi:hypothetical protein
MASADVTAATTVDKPRVSAGAGSRRRWVILVAAVVVATVAVIAGLVFVHWRNGLRLFPAEGSEIGANSLATGRSLYAGAGVQVVAPTHPISLDFDAITPVITANTADATIRVLICVEGPHTESIGAVYSLSGVCISSRPFSPGRYRLASYASTDGTVAVILQITPKRAGHVHVAGLHVRYHRGLRNGSQVTGVEVDTRTP